MGARAMYKAVIELGALKVPVKLYSGLQDRDVHFRILHQRDHAPVKQQMVNPDTDEVVPRENLRRGYFTPEGDLVMLDDEELNELEPESSREIKLLRFLPREEIDHRWYRRPYYLGPDGNTAKYAALIAALEQSGREGLAQWVMRKKAYIGALRLHGGYPMLIALRHAEEVISIDTLQTPSGAELDERELNMAQQLINMLAAGFEPENYQDQYRERVLQLIETKASGGKVTAFRPRPREKSEDLRKALEASLQQEKQRAQG